MKHVVTPIVLGASLLLAPGLGFAATPSTLSNAQLDAVTAGNQPHNSANPNSVAQYDVAGFQQSQHGH